MDQLYGHCFNGVDYSTPPHELPITALADASNVVPTEAGLPTGRGGSVKYNSTSLASRVTSFHEFKSGSTRNQLVSYSTKVGSYNSTTGDFVDKITGLTSDKMFQWVNFRGKAIGVNEGSDAPQYWTDDSNNGDLAGSPPKGNSIATWQNRVWLGGDSTNVALLTGSALNDATDYSTDVGEATGYVSQTIGDSKVKITAVFPYFDMLIVGKLNSLYKLTGAPATDGSTLQIDPLYSKIGDSVGFTSPWAITQVGNEVLFQDGYDIKRLSGIQEYGDIETISVIPHFRDYLKSVVDKDYLQYTQFFHYKQKKQIWVSIPTGAATHYVFILDYKFKSMTGRYGFYPLGNLTVNCFGGVEDGEVTDIYYGDESGYVHQLDTASDDDNGSAIDRYFVQMVSGNDIANKIITRHQYRKQFQASETFIQPTESVLAMTPYYALDLMDGAQVRTSDNYTSLGAQTVTGWNGTGVNHNRIRMFGINGRTLALKWRHNTLAQNFIFQPSVLKYDIKSKTTIA